MYFAIINRPNKVKKEIMKINQLINFQIGLCFFHAFGCLTKP
ncbi:hypothetical protein NARC_160022 [Candidatus Nitrosocosmicus arcticus]|uniref:Uncharacterized protein n=1 Tax=Candidatus Nitrosocosmicus arcticus TaxID=2035267 RepID=A0A557SRT8_9ARCH|nr:hypothetical protein NARC_160022 [Candidatus Nitrosocosmicus arcticus]